MAKFLKSLFQANNKKSRGAYDKELEEDSSECAPPRDGRRRLSISRSGRMKQNKKRSSLSTELYGESFQAVDKPASQEYHVHGRTYTENNNTSLESDATKPKSCHTGRREETAIKTPEEEIDSAFEIIDKS